MKLLGNTLSRTRIAEANYYPGGMEFPTFIMMDSSKYQEPHLSNTSLEINCHEVAHQWWYAMVGSDQINEPWLDEGITEYYASISRSVTENQDGSLILEGKWTLLQIL